MRTDAMGRLGRWFGLALGVGVLLASFLLAVRPWYLTWGASEREAREPLPGDELLSGITAQTTRALTIDAPAPVVWAWLAQLGQDRAGFYSYELLEDMVGTRMPHVDELRPELQRWQLGDKLWMYPPEKLGGAGHGVLQRLDPGRALVFGTRQIGKGPSEPTDGTWAFVLRPLAPERTRLLVRGRAAVERSLAWCAYDRLIFEPIHFLMERKMMEGIAARAEGRVPSRLADTLEVLSFGACFALFVLAAVQLLRWPPVRRSLVLLLLTGAALQLLTFVQPPWLVALLIVGGLAVPLVRVPRPAYPQH